MFLLVYQNKQGAFSRTKVSWDSDRLYGTISSSFRVFTTTRKKTPPVKKGVLCILNIYGSEMHHKRMYLSKTETESTKLLNPYKKNIFVMG